MTSRRVLRSFFFWIHLAVGLSAGLLILLMSITGVMLGFERQMIAWTDGAPRVVAPATDRLPLDTLLARAGIQRDAVASIVVMRNPAQPVTVRFRERGATPLLIDPYRATVLRANGDGSGKAFFSALRRWHRWVGAQGTELRAQMKVLNGAANLMFLGLVLSGLYLWWPRRWTLARLRTTGLPQWRHRAGRVRDFNWHNSLGFWFALPLALIIASGAFFSFRWPGQYLDLALGSAAEKTAAREAINGARSPAPGARTTPGRVDSPGSLPPARALRESEAPLGAMVEAATAARPNWAQLSVTMPDAQATNVRVAVAEGNTYRPDLRWTLDLDRASAAVRASTGYADLSSARKIRAWVRFGHTGEVFGIVGQLLATITSAVAVLLVWTGFALAWRRLRQFLRRPTSVPTVAPLPDASLESPAPLR